MRTAATATTTTTTAVEAAFAAPPAGPPLFLYDATIRYPTATLGAAVGDFSEPPPPPSSAVCSTTTAAAAASSNAKGGDVLMVLNHGTWLSVFRVVGVAARTTEGDVDQLLPADDVPVTAEDDDEEEARLLGITKPRQVGADHRGLLDPLPGAQFLGPVWLDGAATVIRAVPWLDGSKALFVMFESESFLLMQFTPPSLDPAAAAAHSPTAALLGSTPRSSRLLPCSISTPSNITNATASVPFKVLSKGSLRSSTYMRPGNGAAGLMSVHPTAAVVAVHAYDRQVSIVDFSAAAIAHRKFLRDASTNAAGDEANGTTCAFEMTPPTAAVVGECHLTESNLADLLLLSTANDTTSLLPVHEGREGAAGGRRPSTSTGGGATILLALLHQDRHDRMHLNVLFLASAGGSFAAEQPGVAPSSTGARRSLFIGPSSLQRLEPITSLRLMSDVDRAAQSLVWCGGPRCASSSADSRGGGGVLIVGPSLATWVPFDAAEALRTLTLTATDQAASGSGRRPGAPTATAVAASATSARSSARPAGGAAIPATATTSSARELLARAPNAQEDLRRLADAAAALAVTVSLDDAASIAAAVMRRSGTRSYMPSGVADVAVVVPTCDDDVRRRGAVGSLTFIAMRCGALFAVRIEEASAATTAAAAGPPSRSAKAAATCSYVGQLPTAPQALTILGQTGDGTSVVACSLLSDTIVAAAGQCRSDSTAALSADGWRLQSTVLLGNAGPITTLIAVPRTESLGHGNTGDGTGGSHSSSGDLLVAACGSGPTAGLAVVRTGVPLHIAAQVDGLPDVADIAAGADDAVMVTFAGGQSHNTLLRVPPSLLGGVGAAPKQPDDVEGVNDNAICPIFREDAFPPTSTASEPAAATETLLFASLFDDTAGGAEARCVSLLVTTSSVTVTSFSPSAAGSTPPHATETIPTKSITWSSSSPITHACVLRPHGVLCVTQHSSLVFCELGPRGERFLADPDGVMVRDARTILFDSEVSCASLIDVSGDVRMAVPEGPRARAAGVPQPSTPSAKRPRKASPFQRHNQLPSGSGSPSALRTAPDQPDAACDDDDDRTDGSDEVAVAPCSSARAGGIPTPEEAVPIVAMCCRDLGYYRRRVLCLCGIWRRHQVLAIDVDGLRRLPVGAATTSVCHPGDAASYGVVQALLPAGDATMGAAVALPTVARSLAVLPAHRPSLVLSFPSLPPTASGDTAEGVEEAAAFPSSASTSTTSPLSVEVHVDACWTLIAGCSEGVLASCVVHVQMPLASPWCATLNGPDLRRHAALAASVVSGSLQCTRGGGRSAIKVVPVSYRRQPAVLCCSETPVLCFLEGSAQGTARATDGDPQLPSAPPPPRLIIVDVDVGAGPSTCVVSACPLDAAVDLNAAEPRGALSRGPPGRRLHLLSSSYHHPPVTPWLALVISRSDAVTTSLVLCSTESLDGAKTAGADSAAFGVRLTKRTIGAPVRALSYFPPLHGIATAVACGTRDLLTMYRLCDASVHPSGLEPHPGILVAPSTAIRKSSSTDDKPPAAEFIGGYLLAHGEVCTALGVLSLPYCVDRATVPLALSSSGAEQQPIAATSAAAPLEARFTPTIAVGTGVFDAGEQKETASSGRLLLLLHTSQVATLCALSGIAPFLTDDDAPLANVDDPHHHRGFVVVTERGVQQNNFGAICSTAVCSAPAASSEGATAAAGRKTVASATIPVARVLVGVGGGVLLLRWSLDAREPLPQTGAKLRQCLKSGAPLGLGELVHESSIRVGLAITRIIPLAVGRQGSTGAGGSDAAPPHVVWPAHPDGGGAASPSGNKGTVPPAVPPARSDARLDAIFVCGDLLHSLLLIGVSSVDHSLHLLSRDAHRRGICDVVTLVTPATSSAPHSSGGPGGDTAASKRPRGSSSSTKAPPVGGQAAAPVSLPPSASGVAGIHAIALEDAMNVFVTDVTFAEHSTDALAAWTNAARQQRGGTDGGVVNSADVSASMQGGPSHPVARAAHEWRQLRTIAAAHVGDRGTSAVRGVLLSAASSRCHPFLATSTGAAGADDGTTALPFEGGGGEPLVRGAQAITYGTVLGGLRCLLPLHASVHGALRGAPRVLCSLLDVASADEASARPQSPARRSGGGPYDQGAAASFAGGGTTHGWIRPLAASADGRQRFRRFKNDFEPCGGGDIAAPHTTGNCRSDVVDGDFLERLAARCAEPALRPVDAAVVAASCVADEEEHSAPPPQPPASLCLALSASGCIIGVADASRRRPSITRSERERTSMSGASSSSCWSQLMHQPNGEAAVVDEGAEAEGQHHAGVTNGAAAAADVPPWLSPQMALTVVRDMARLH